MDYIGESLIHFICELIYDGFCVMYLIEFIGIGGMLLGFYEIIVVNKNIGVSEF